MSSGRSYPTPQHVAPHSHCAAFFRITSQPPGFPFTTPRLFATLHLFHRIPAWHPHIRTYSGYESPGAPIVLRPSPPHSPSAVTLHLFRPFPGPPRDMLAPPSFTYNGYESLVVPIVLHSVPS